MKRILLLAVISVLLGAWISPAWSHNPFTSKPDTQHKAPKPLFKSKIFIKIIVWQHKLKQKMSDLIRAAKNERQFKPLIFLLGVAFLYGVIHAAGPGHGKVVAMTYVLSHRATIMGGVFFGVCFALIHAFSGAVGVLGLQYIIQSSVSDTLASATTTTQIVSFALITILGLGILFKHGRAFFSPAAHDKGSETSRIPRKGVLAWAVAVGLVPCPAVVMVMLFCLSMEVMMLGLLLAACISIGMATTISFVVITIILGKTGIMRTVSAKYAGRVEGILGVLSGGATVAFGTLFLISTIHTAVY
jgi:ABC-type nickel/cobalt efflux system permease component RcnA